MLKDVNSSHTSFVPNVPGVYVIELLVLDETGSGSIDTARISVGD